MSSLFLFNQRKWFRRLWLIGLGLVLCYGYWFQFIEGVILVPAGLGFIIGMLSHSLLAAFINTVIVLISYVVGLIIFILAGNIGSGQPLVLEQYQALTADAFVLSVTPMYFWIPFLLIGLIARFFLLKLISPPAEKS